MKPPFISLLDPSTLDVYVQDGPQLNVSEQMYLSAWIKPRYPMPATMTNTHWARHIEWIEDCYWWEQADEKAYLMFGRQS